jgi:LacI family transcriptional regulator
LELLAELADCPLPVIALNAPPASQTDICFFSCDNEGGMRLAVDHLVDLGHQRILFAMELGETETPDAQARLQGMRMAMAAHGLGFGDDDVVCWDFRTSEFQAWFASQPPQTAIIAWNEGIAGSIIVAAREAGILIPDQLSVIGFDSTPYCDSMVPRLTAVKQPISEMAHEATRHLLDILGGADSAGSSVKFTCTLDVRESTARPPVPPKSWAR